MRKIDWNKFIFISKGEWFVKGTYANCIETYCNPNINDQILDACGLFIGESIVDCESDACPFHEFDIYYNGISINEFTYLELFKLMESVD